MYCDFTQKYSKKPLLDMNACCVPDDDIQSTNVDVCLCCVQRYCTRAWLWYALAISLSRALVARSMQNCAHTPRKTAQLAPGSHYSRNLPPYRRCFKCALNRNTSILCPRANDLTLPVSGSHNTNCYHGK